MPVTHRILRPISGVDHLPPGSLVDVTGWRTVDKLVDQRYLEPLSAAEVEAHSAAKSAKIDKVKTATPKNSKPLAVAPAEPPTGDEQPPPTGDEQPPPTEGDEQPKTAGAGPGKSGKPPQAAKN